MEQFEIDIKKANTERIDAIVKSFGDVGSLLYNDDFSVKKKGKEIKEKLTTLQTLLNSKITDILSKLPELIENIGKEPDGSIIGMYRSYKRDYNNNDGEDLILYNDLLYDLRNLRDNSNDVAFLLRTIPDDKEYKLNANKARDLGF